MYTQHFIIEGKYHGECQRAAVLTMGAYVAPRSYSFACPVCGEQWAKCPVLAENGRESEWMHWTLPCKKHSASRSSIPGSLHMAWEPEFNKSFPDAVVQWEFTRHMAILESVI